MRVSDILSMGFCSKYSEEELREIAGEGDFGWETVYNANISTGDKILVLFRAFLTKEDAKTMARNFVIRAGNGECDNNSDYIFALENSESDDYKELISSLSRACVVIRGRQADLRSECELLLEEIMECLQSY